MRPSLRKTAAAAALAALTACASAPPPRLYQSQQYMQAQQAQEKGADPSKLMICEQTMVTGSHIPTTHCWSKMQMDVARERAQRTADENQRIDRR